MYDEDAALYVLDYQGYPVRERNLEIWAEWFRRLENRRVAYTRISDTWEVSTVFLGIEAEEHAFFETATWKGDECVGMRRHADRQEALMGHDAAVELARGSAGCA